ncbi:MAG: hypothetical protein MJ144_04700, partial [Clostridia bacterium]|nr:hypothetical protein [Clostridia bacterium]
MGGNAEMTEKNGRNSLTIELLRDRGFNLGALIFMLILAITETIMAYSQDPVIMTSGNQPGIWIDVCVTWGCLVLFFICMMNLKTATPPMLVFAELTWISSFSAMVDGMSYIVDCVPGLEVINFIYSSLSFLTGPTLAYVFLHFVVNEKSNVTRRMINIVRISTVAFVIDIVFVILGCIFGWMFTIEPGNVYTEYNNALFVVYPLAQLLVCLLIILISRDFKAGDKLLMSIFAVAPIVTTLISNSTEIYFNIHHMVLIMIMMLMYGMLYTKRNEEMLRKDISEVRRQELERQKNMDIIEALSEDFDYVSMVTIGETVEKDVVTECRIDTRLEEIIPNWKEETRFGERLKILRDRVVHKDDREHFGQMAKRNVVLDKLKTYGSHFINFRAILNGRELYYQLKFMPIYNDEGEIEGFVAGVHNVDAETRQEMESREQIERIVKIQTDELKEKNSSLNKMNEGIVELLGNITEGRDDESGVHVQSVKKYTYLLAR